MFEGLEGVGGLEQNYADFDEIRTMEKKVMCCIFNCSDATAHRAWAEMTVIKITFYVTAIIANSYMLH